MTLRNLRLEPRHVRTLIIAAQTMQAGLGNSNLEKIVNAELEDTLGAMVLQVPEDFEVVESLESKRETQR